MSTTQQQPQNGYSNGFGRLPTMVPPPHIYQQFYAQMEQQRMAQNPSNQPLGKSAIGDCQQVEQSSKQPIMDDVMKLVNDDGEDSNSYRLDDADSDDEFSSSLGSNGIRCLFILLH